METPAELEETERGAVASNDQLGSTIKDAIALERERCAKLVEAYARKWWSIHCESNKHMQTTRKAHDDFCALQTEIRRA